MEGLAVVILDGIRVNIPVNGNAEVGWDIHSETVRIVKTWYNGPPLTGSITSAIFVDPGRMCVDIGTVLSPNAEVMSWVSNLTFDVSPQFATVATLLTRSKGITLLGRIVIPTFGPDTGTVPALIPEAVGAARTMLASMSLAGLCRGRGPVVAMALNRKSDAGLRTGIAIIGVISGTTIASVDTGGRKRSE